MSSAQSYFKEQDRSAIVSSLSGIYGAIVTPATKGPEEAFLATGEYEYIKTYGIPNPKMGVAHYSALNYLGQSNKLWVKRVVADNAKYSAALVRTKIEELPTGIPDGSWSADSVVSPILAGLTKAELASYTFPQYIGERVYARLSLTVVEEVLNSNRVRVNSLDGIEKGNKISFSLSSLTPDINSPWYEVESISEEEVSYDKITLSGTVTVKTGDMVRQVSKNVIPFSVPVSLTNDVVAGDKAIKVSVLSIFQLEVNQTLIVGNDTMIVSGVDLNTLTVSFKEPFLEAHAAGAEVKLEKREYRNYPNLPLITRDFSGSNEILVSDSDDIGNGDLIAIGSGLTTSLLEVTVQSKDTYKETHKFVTLDKKATIAAGLSLYHITQYEFEYRDCMMVYGANRGSWTKDISFGITPSTNYTEDDVTEDFTLPFTLLVYYKGALVETWTDVSLTEQIDGNSKQMFIESRINGKSDYINVLVNENHLVTPLYTDYSIWRRNPTDLFWNIPGESEEVTILEDLIAGDINIRVSSFTNVSLGDRVKFYGYAQEYKVTNKTSWVFDGKPYFEITLDRGVVIEATNAVGKIPSGVKLTKFDATVTNSASGIYSGTQFYPISKLDAVYYNYPIGSKFTISGIVGTLLDAGVNLMTGGSLGDAIEVGDLIQGLKTFASTEEFNVQLFMDGGFAYPAYAQALANLCEARGASFAYLSTDPSAEESSNYKSDIVAYRDSLNLNTSYASLFSGWVKVYDSYNKKNVWVSPDGFAAASQAFTTRNFAMWYPAAGWTRGKLTALDIKRKFSVGDRDYLYDHQVNPIRYKQGSGYVIWGNKTLLTKPSPLQLRSVRMLLIVIKYGLEPLMDWKLFDLNSERTWTTTETSIDVFMRDEIKAKEGVTSYQVAVSKLITDSDKENNRMPVFLGIKPTPDIEEIPVTIGIFSASQTITVSI